jgi:hypothetical protein
VVVVAHNPIVGVNVYVIVLVLFKAGDQLPVIPLLEIKDNAANVAPEHIGVTALNKGTILGLTTMIKLEGIAHCPTVGVKV